MKIALVAQNASFTHTCPAVRILKNCLCENGFCAEIIETTINEHGGVAALAEKMYAQEADIYAFSVYIWNRTQQLEAAEVIKKLLPNTVVVLGGPEISFENQDFFDVHPYVDYIISGEGEKAIVDIALGKYEKRSIVDGGIFEGFCQSDEPYFASKYSRLAPCGSEEGRLVYYESSRGCPYNCSYCLSSVKQKGERVRFKPTTLVISELCELLRHKIKTIKLVDRTFNADKQRAKEIFARLIELSQEFCKGEKYIGTSIHFEICAALLDDETIELLSKAPEGLFQFEIGVQTTNPKSLMAIGRKDDSELIIKNVKQLYSRTRVHLHLDLICGLPLDTYDGVASSFDAIYGICHCIQVGILKLLPGTRMRNEAEKYGIKYLDNPPYTILQSSTMSFQQLRRLMAIGDCAERLSMRDNPYYRAIDYLVKMQKSPFSFYERLSEWLEGRGVIAAKKMYVALLEFARTNEKLSPERLATFSEYLTLDYLLSNQGALPLELARSYSDEQRQRLKMALHVFIHSSPKGESGFFIPATEAHIFDFDSSHIYIIDRKNRLYKTVLAE